MKILAFSKFIAFNVGGAEKSLLKELDKKDASVTLLSVSDGGNFERLRERNTTKNTTRIEFIEPRCTFNRFFYTEYSINRDIIKDEIVRLSSSHDQLWTQNLWAPIAVNSFDGYVKYFARDESFLCKNTNCHRGLKYYAKKLYECIDSIGFSQYKRDQFKAIKRADEVIANSYYMAEQIYSLYGVTSNVILPDINEEYLKSSYGRLNTLPHSGKGVVLIGDSKVKGIDLFIEISKHFPNEHFYVFGRAYSVPVTQGNITYMPWVSEPAEAYRLAKLVLVPSIWPEAYGRVAAEAKALGIPCIVSRCGGLPEAVNYDENAIANSLDQFINKAKNFLAS